MSIKDMFNEEARRVMNNLVKEINIDVIGRCSSYGEDTSDFFNPVMIGMRFQRIKDNLKILLTELGLKIKKGGYGYSLGISWEDK